MEAARRIGRPAQGNRGLPSSESPNPSPAPRQLCGRRQTAVIAPAKSAAGTSQKYLRASALINGLKRLDCILPPVSRMSVGTYFDIHEWAVVKAGQPVAPQQHGPARSRTGGSS